MGGNGFVKLRISGEGLDFEKISEKLGQSSTFSYRKGDTFTPKIGDRKPVVYEEDCWIVEAEKVENETIEKTIENFVLRFQPATDFIKQLTNKYKVTLWISLYPDGEQSHLHLTAETLKFIGNMNISVDCDISFLKEFYEGAYDDKSCN